MRAARPITSSTTDYEQPTYDANSNVTSRRLRDGTSIGFTLDNLDRTTFKNLPGTEPDVAFGYDHLGRLTSASQTANSLSFTYDALGRKLTETGPQGTVSSAWDLANRRTRLTWPDSFYVDYDYLVTGEMWKVRENGATSGIGVLATYGYDNLGNRVSITRGNGANTAYSYDSVSRLTSLSHDLAGTSADLTIGSIAYNPAHQIVSQNRSNDLYAFTGHANGSTATVSDGLNRLVTVGGVTAGYDARGNLTTDPATAKSYGHSSENLLTSASGGGGPSVTLAHDPLLRLSLTTSSAAGALPLRYQQDGLDTVGLWQIDPVYGPALLFRYVPGADIDEPVAEYYAPLSRREFFHADERGSVITLSDNNGALTAWNRYDEYGQPDPGNYGRFQYTGQKWIGEAGLYYYKARTYLPGLGIFGQPDPIGYAGSANLYPYVLNDPVNLVDPLGSCVGGGGQTFPGRGDSPVVIQCPRLRLGIGIRGPSSSRGPVAGRTSLCVGDCRPIVITARRKTQKLTQCQIAFLEDVLGRRGLPTAQVKDLKFVSGLGPKANSFTRMAYNSAGAVTQGNTVYVRPEQFDKVANFRSPVGFEEAYHSAQFALEGGAGFYHTYGILGLGGLLSTGSSYRGNAYETFAQGASREIFAESQAFMCK